MTIRTAYLCFAAAALALACSIHRGSTAAAPTVEARAIEAPAKQKPAEMGMCLDTPVEPPPCTGEPQAAR